MKKIFLIIAQYILLSGAFIQAQDLDKLLENVAADSTPDFVYGTFKGTSIINSQSVEVPGDKDLHFVISHRFGAVNTGLYNFFGLDQGTTRLGFEYGIKNIVGLSLGRSTYDKTYDGGIKIKFLRQQTGIRTIPLSVSVYSAFFVETIKWEVPDRENLFSSRLSYATELMIARKFNRHLSLQLTPSYVHFNLVPENKDQNNIFAIGMGGRYKLAPNIALTGDFFYLLPGETASDYSNSLSLGIDIETGGHVFQLHFTNSQLMFAPGYIARTEGEWLNGDIYIGFNIYRIFSLERKDKVRKKTKTEE
jgi:hypothetical protein